MDKKLIRIALAELREGNLIVKYLNTKDEELRKVEPRIDFPSQRGMKVLENIGIFDNPKKFEIPILLSDNPYFKLVELFDIDYSQESNKLGSIDDINYKDISGDSFQPNLAIYYFEENNSILLYLTSVKKRQLLIKDKVLFQLGSIEFKEHSGPERSIPVAVSEIENGLDLPMSNFLCEISRTDGKYSIKIYDVFSLDSELQLTSHINEYARKTLNRFSSQNDERLTLTKDNVNVDINISDVESIVTTDFKLSRSLSLYNGNGNRTINQIDKSQLCSAIERLREHVNDENSPYCESDIPEFIDEENKIKVQGNQIKIFAALLDNKIVEKILDNKIELPFFD